MPAATIHLDAESVEIPKNVRDLASFREWAHSDDFPEQGRICYLRGTVSVDMSMEQLFSHNLLRTEVTIVVGGLVRSQRSGKFFTDGALFSNVDADVSNEPDAMFVSHDAIESGRVRLIEGKDGGFVELEGSPEMLLEIVSDSSVEKDTVTLKAAYAKAGVREYWLIDARDEKLRFEIFRNSAHRFVSVKKQSGWLTSSVFGRSFRLTAVHDARGHPEFTLEVRG